MSLSLLFLKQTGATVLRSLLPFTVIAGLAAPAAFAQDAPRPALWSVTDEDSTIYLFGTVHILDPALQWRTAEVDEAIAGSDTVYFEAPADTSNPAATQQLVLKYGLNTPGVTLSSQLSAEGKENYAKMLEQLGLTAAAANLEPLRPWLVGLTFAGLQIQAIGGNPEAGVENIIKADLEGSDKTIAYFETDEQQLQFLSGMSPEGEIAFFEEGLKGSLENPDVLTELINHWRSGSVEELGALTQESMAAVPEVYEILLTQRNNDWAETIDELMQGSGVTFVAVGAAHLAGQDSVQSLLEARGHEITRLQ